MRLSDRRILVTGASSGIGRALAIELAERGARLAIAARSREGLEQTAAEIQRRGTGSAALLPCDLAERGEAAGLAERAVAELGGIDVLVNNAGGGVGGTQSAVGDRDEAREAFEVNYWSPLALTAALVPQMRRRGDGAVVNVTSMGQAMPVWAMGHYVASKGAMALGTESLRLELRETGVHVLHVIPGPIDTAIQGESRLLPGAERLFRGAPLGSAGRLARLTARALERDRPRLVYPRSLRLIYAVPGLYRTYIGWMAGRLSAELDPEDDRVIRTGSQGDPIAREARAAWLRKAPTA